MPSAFLERLAAACFTPSFEVLVAQKEGLCKFFIEMSWEHQEDVLCQGTLNLPASEAPLKCLAFRPFRPIMALSMAFCVSIFHLGLKWTETDGWTVIHRLVSGSSVFFSEVPGICGQIGTPSSLCGKKFTKVARVAESQRHGLVDWHKVGCRQAHRISQIDC